jgi:hypothetical protein
VAGAAHRVDDQQMLDQPRFFAAVQVRGAT